MLKPWEGVDGVLVINMDSNPARYESFLAAVAPHLPTERLERLSAVAGRELPSFGKPPWFTERTGERAKFWGGTAGCALSHAKAISYAQEKGWKNVLIFEDDVVLTNKETLGLVVAGALSIIEGDYLLYLGYNKPAPYGRKVEAVNGAELWKTSGCLATHAYLVPQSLYALLLNSLPKGEADVWMWLSKYKAIDVFYRDFLPMMGADIYVVNPPMCVQADSVSDIGGTASVGEDMSCAGPIPCYGVRRLLRILGAPLRRLKIKLNSIRTHRRAVKGGFPGPRKRKK